MKRISFHAVLLGIVLCVTASARYALRSRYTEERRMIESAAFKQRVGEIARFWNAFHFSQGPSEQLSREILRRDPSRLLQLSGEQQDKLQRRLNEVLRLLFDPGFEEYFCLKTRDFHWRMQPDTNVLRLLGTNAPVQAVDEASNARNIAKAVWDQVHGKAKSANTPRIVGLCLTNAAVAISRTNSPEAIMGGKAGKGFTVAREAVDPGFHYPVSVAASGLTPAPELFVHMSFFARSSVSSNAGPVHISLRWSAKDRQWVLSRLFTDMLLNMNVLF